MRSAARAYGITIEEPQWVELQRDRSENDYIQAIQSDIDPKVV
jgi:hypothetical protein